MKTSNIVAAGKRYLAQKTKEYTESNPVPEAFKKANPTHPVTKNGNVPGRGWQRKTVFAFLQGHNLHEAFVDDILPLEGDEE
jgi:hypothetical protein